MPGDPQRRSGRGRAWRAAMLAIGLGYLGVLVGLPVVSVFWNALSGGLPAFLENVVAGEALHAAQLTLLVVAIVVPANTAFGLAAAWLIARRPSALRGLVATATDLPLAISPTIVGLLVVMAYSPTIGLAAPLVAATHAKVLFAWPGIALATLIVTLPYVAREILPAVSQLDRSEEEAAATLGASAWQSFVRVTFPAIRWSVVYGVVLCTAKTVGEFGAVSVVSGKLIGETNTLTLHVERAYAEYETGQAYACAAVLTSIALVTLGVQALLERKGGVPTASPAGSRRAPSRGSS